MKDNTTTALLLGTRKGAFFLLADPGRGTFRVEGPHLLGSVVHHVVADRRSPETVLLAARTGHLGPTVFRSTDGGVTFAEVAKPPAFEKKEGGRSVHHVFWLTPGLASEPGHWYAGTSPQGLFRSTDGGDTWEGVDGLNENPMLPTWSGGIGDSTPDGPLLHSILIDPRDKAHLYIGMSGGGTFESVDAGGTWTPLNHGVAADFLPAENPEFGHDPHCMAMHPDRPDRIWQQNHCGVYRIDRPGTEWVRIGDNLPKEVGDIGFPVVLHPRDPDTAFVFPMDGTDVWPRICPGGRPAVYRTRDGGESWDRLDHGFPAEQAWLTVLRQSMAEDGEDPLGIYIGTTCGEVWGSTDEGATWRTLARHLPRILSLETARFAR